MPVLLVWVDGVCLCVCVCVCECNCLRRQVGVLNQVSFHQVWKRCRVWEEKGGWNLTKRGPAPLPTARRSTRSHQGRLRSVFIIIRLLNFSANPPLYCLKEPCICRYLKCWNEFWSRENYDSVWEWVRICVGATLFCLPEVWNNLVGIIFCPSKNGHVIKSLSQHTICMYA